MDYLKEINDTLVVQNKFHYSALDLFAGCGGLSLGFESCGIRTLGYEMESDYCNTYNNNLLGKCINEKLSLKTEYPNVDIVIGGPPCQPFSVGGKQQGLNDSRDGFPIFIDAIKKTKPKIWLFENVRGLFYKNKKYLEEILDCLEELNYCVELKLMNASDFGVPQNRERLIVIGHKGEFNFPEKSTKKVTVNEAIGDIINIPDSEAKYLTPSMDKYIKKYELASSCVNPRDLHLDRPARTLTCRNLAGSTGDMHRIKLDDGRRRKITIREAARLQSFPDWFQFHGTETSQFYQIGNAVPPILSYKLASCIKEYLQNPTNINTSCIRKREKQMELAIHGL